MGLEFCPYEADIYTKEFQKIDTSNLAYELIFMKGHSYDELKNTVLGAENPIIHNEPDKRLRDAYRDTSIHYMLWESQDGGKNGLEKLLEWIDNGNKNVQNQVPDASKFDWTNGEGGGNESAETGFKLVYEKEEMNSSYVISYAAEKGRRKDPLMKAVPCCPNCHMRLPIGWLTAEEFCPVSMIGRTKGGKTTYETSLRVDGWDALRCLGKGWVVNAAHETSPGEDYWYTLLSQAADRMVGEYGNKPECPQETNPEKWIAPVFLMVTYRGHRMIAGIYDNSGETFKDMTALDHRLYILSNMYAHIYLIEPKQMLVNLPEEETQVQETEPMELKTIEEQGRLQEQHRGEQILAADLLRPARVVNPAPVGKKEDPFRMLKDYQELLVKTGVLDRMQHQHLCATVIKCDQLEGLPEMDEVNHSRFLFEHGIPVDLFDQQEARQEIVKDMFQKYIFPIRRGSESFLENSMESVSYHCVSALGCGTYQSIEDREVTEIVEGRLTTGIKSGVEVHYLNGEYDPIRVAEPLAYCLKKKVEELGWSDED